MAFAHASKPKFTKEEVGYESPAKGREHCKDCVHFEVPNHCEVVSGIIQPSDWCEKWQAK